MEVRHDEAGRLTATTNPEGVDTVSNTWDPAGRLVEQLSAPGRRTTFEYDENHRVVTVTDPLGNRSTRDYDRAGNLTRQAGPGSVTGYRFDSRDRLVQVHTPSNQHVHYTYDAVGRMQTRRLGTETRPTRLEWDGCDLASEVAPNGQDTTYHVPEGEILGFRRGNQTCRLHADAIGSARNVCNPNRSETIGTVDDAWGQRLSVTVALVGALHPRFAGGLGVWFDLDTGLYYMRNRATLMSNWDRKRWLADLCHALGQGRSAP